MELPDNVIKHHLRDVYFISGSACGGKTTIARYLSTKHGIALYNWDERYPEHKAISDTRYQPFMNKEYGSWEVYFNRPPAEYADALRRSIGEQVEMAILEQISMAPQGRIIADGVFPCRVLQRISSNARVVFLMADMAAIRSDYFKRDDKQDMLMCLNSLEDPQRATENMFRSIEHILSQEMEEVKTSGFRWIMRDQRPDWQGIRLAVEQHLQLIQ